MLPLFFNRKSIVMRALFGIAAFLTFLYFYKGRFYFLTPIQEGLFYFSLFQVFFNTAILFYPWYPKNSRGLGITLQFQKAFVPVAYLWAVFMIGIWIKPVTFLLILYNLLLLPMGIVACILIYLYIRDPGRQTVNLLSGFRKV